jgi:hypothetical protein
MTIAREVAEAARKAVEECVEPDQIEDVIVTEPEDEFLEFLDVFVLLVDPSQLTASVRSRILAALREQLLAVREERFPLPRFLSREDARELGLAAE